MTDTYQPTAPQSPLAPPTDPIGPPSPSPMDRAISGIEGAQARSAETFAAQQSALAPRYNALSRTIAAPLPQPPKPQQVGPAPDVREYQQNSLAWLGAMAVLGAVASRFTRASGTASLAAFNGALKGWQEGNLQAYESAAKQWEQNSKATIENNATELAAYKTTLENRKLNIDQQMSQIQLIAAQYQDKMMFDASTAKNYTMVAQLYQKKEEFGIKTAEAYEKLNEKRENDRAKLEATATYWLSPEGQARLPTLTPEQQGSVKQMIDLYSTKMGGGPTDPATIERLARQDLTGDQSWKTNVGRGAQGGAILQAVAKRKSEIMASEGISADDVARRNQEFKARQVGMSAEERTGATTAANLDIIMRNAHAAIPMAVAASEKVPRGRWVPINQLIQRADAQISDPALKEFKLANLQLAELWARAMNPRGVMRESDRELALGMLSTADSPETYKRVTQQLTNFLERERRSVQEFRQHVEPGQTERPTAPSPTSGPVRVSTPTEAQQLAPGTRYVTPDGQEYTR